MSKELFMVAHEQCVEEYLEENPDADWSTAYEATADAAGKRYRENVADMIDQARDRAKYEGMNNGK